MAHGAGKYDAVLHQALDMATASQGALIVLDGLKGPGFSIHASPDTMTKLPGLMELMARQIRDDVKALGMPVEPAEVPVDQDGERFRFMMRALDDDNSPEAQAMNATEEEIAEEDFKASEATKHIDRAMAVLAQFKAGPIVSPNH